MKQLTGLLLSIVLLFSLTACSAAPTEQTPSAGSDPVPENQEATQSPVTPMEMAETVIIDDENCTFTITGVSENAHLGMALEVFCENKTDKTLLFTWNNTSVCGYMHDPFWAEEVEAGKKANSTIYIDTYQLEEMGITSVDEISFGLYVYDSEDFMAEPFVDEMFTIYPTGQTAQTVSFPVRSPVEGETVIVDNEDLTFIIESVDKEDSQAYTLRCYVNNKTDKDLMVSWDGVSVNDYMIDPFWATVVAAGKQAYGDIAFYRSDLETNGIQEVTDIAFTMTVSDYGDWSGEYILEESYLFRP